MGLKRTIRHKLKSWLDDNGQAAPYDQDGLRTIHDHSFMDDPQFQAAYARGVKATGNKDYHWHWRVHIGLWAATAAAKIPGDFVECGVNYGFLSSAIMQYLDWGKLGRTFYLLDTFGGLDARYVTAEEKAGGKIETNKELISGFYVTNIDTVRVNFSQWKNVKIVQGAVPETLGQVTSERIAYLHLDMNCAPPEIAAAEYFWPRLSGGAIVLLDDYAYQGYKPQKEAMDAFARGVNVQVLSLPTGQGLMVKPAGG